MTNGRGLCYYIGMITNLKQNYYTYNLNEFLPVYHNGQLSNKNAYHFYKFKCAIKALGRAFDKAFERTTPLT